MPTFKPYFRFDRNLFAQAVLGALAAFAVWELWAGWANAFVFGFTFSPIPMVKGLTGIEGDAAAWLAHLVIGVVIYPLAWLLTVRPFIPDAPIISAVVLGFAGWIVAVAVFAPWLGMPFLMNFNPMAQASLVGHLLMGLAWGLVATVVARVGAGRRLTVVSTR